MSEKTNNRVSGFFRIPIAGALGCIMTGMIIMLSINTHGALPWYYYGAFVLGMVFAVLSSVQFIILTLRKMLSPVVLKIVFIALSIISALPAIGSLIGAIVVIIGIITGHVSV